MDCCPCSGGWKKKGKQSTGSSNKVHPLSPDHRANFSGLEIRSGTSPVEEAGDRKTLSCGREATSSLAIKTSKGGCRHTAARAFTIHELASATNNFSADCLLGTGDNYRVYKGLLRRTDQVVAIKLLHCNRLQQRKEFLNEISILSSVHHENLVGLIGFCDHADKQLLVFEYMALGSLADHLHGSVSAKSPLCWNTRMRIAAGLAKGLEYLHDKADPPVIYHNMRSSNVLLEDGYQPKLTGFGLAKLDPYEGEPNMSWGRIWDSESCAYYAPEYFITGHITPKSDIYSFGVVLLELITGRKAVDHSRITGSRLATWARPLLKDAKKYRELADPGLEGQYPSRKLHQALVAAAMCLQENPGRRPLAAELAVALTYLASKEYKPDLSASGGHIASRTAPLSTSVSSEKQERNGTRVLNS